MRPVPPAPPPDLVGRTLRALDAARRVLRVVIGAPDYEGYVAHCQARGAPALERAAFERDRQRARYDRPGARCC